MKYSIKVNEVRAKEGSNIKGFATVVFGDSFKITNIAILENKDKGELFVSMPRYRSNERDESNGVIYKDVCNPITAEFREELYTNIGLILLTVLTVLLVPIRYRADGVWKEEKYIRGRVTWLLHLLSIRVTYEKELLLEVRVAGFLIYPKKERSGKKKKAASGADAEEGVGDADADTNVLDADGAKMPSADVKTLGESAPAAGTTDEPQTQTVAEASEPQSADPRGSATTRMPDVESQSTDPNETSASEADAQATDSDAAPEHPAGSFFEKLSGKLSQVTDRLRRMQQKTDQLKQQTAYYKRIWDQPQTRQAIRVGFYELGEIIRHVLPRKLEVFGIVGTGDPASTGQIMAIQGMLYPWHKGNIRLEPDFEEKYIEGELYLKGRIRLGALGICGLRILLNKNVRRLIRILRKKEEA